MTGYTDTLRKWAADTRRAGLLRDPDGTGEIGLEAGEAGRRLAVRFTLRVRRDTVTDARYQVFGCGFTMAACAAAADLAVGRPLVEIPDIGPAGIDAFLDGLPEERRYCAELAAAALQAAARSVRDKRGVVHTSLLAESVQAPKVTGADPVYALLVSSPPPAHARDEDRHLFACLLALAAREPCETAAALGLVESDLSAILKAFFPSIDRSQLKPYEEPVTKEPPPLNPEVLSVLLDHLLDDPGGPPPQTSTWLAAIIASRAEHPGHLWVTMGLSERPQLSAAIQRHLPALARANQRNMRWKRFLYKQVCERKGGVLCKTPDCGSCSDYALCFAAE